MALGRTGSALGLAAGYSRAGGRLRIRLLRAEGRARGTAEPRAIGCGLSYVLQPPGKTRQQCGAVVRRSRKAVFHQGFCLVGLSEDETPPGRARQGGEQGPPPGAGPPAGPGRSAAGPAPAPRRAQALPSGRFLPPGNSWTRPATSYKIDLYFFCLGLWSLSPS
ncbi:hypothetical protein MC885_012565 [Smutsia gigantea]|nr:hypothetical protein MC885_012565 [Smutsia gigantea]